MSGSGARERRRALDLDNQQAKAQLVRVYRRDKGICQLCKRPCSVESASREHRVRLADGGSTLDTNVILAHKTCNNLADPARELNLTGWTSQSPGWDAEDTGDDEDDPETGTD